MMATPTANADSSVRDSISYTTKNLGITKLKPQQEKALESFLRGHDIFLGLPTGYGKSVVFQGAALCIDYINNVKGKGAMKSFVIVVMPLRALIKDQLDRARKLGIAAADMSGGLTDELSQQISSGKLSLLMTSPEFLTGDSGSEFLKLDYVQQRLCGFFVDESHCVTRWGQSSGKTQAFRASYGQLGELRSTLPSVPVVAMTATATADVRNKVAQSLGMRNYITIVESPDKPNIKHVVLETKKRDFDDSLKFLVDELKSKGQQCERVILYCQSRKLVSELYAMFHNALPDLCAPFVEMFHTNTETDVQERIIADMGNPSGRIRVLIATIAFGMGIDVKGIHCAVMLGRPSDLDDYLQMAGRIGRDGKESLCMTVKYPGDVTGRRISNLMDSFLKGSECRRRVINESYKSSHGTGIDMHGCCDLCAKRCTCSGDTCGVETSRFESLARKCLSIEVEVSEFPVNIPTPSQRDKLQRCLEEYRNELVQEYPDHLYSGKDIASGLPESTISRIIRESNVQMSEQEYMRRYHFGSAKIGQKTWRMYLMALERNDCSLLNSHGTPVPQDESDGSDVWSGDEFADAIIDWSNSDSD